MIKVGVIGAGHLGKIHLNILNNSDFELVGFYDTDVFNSEKLSQEKGYFFFKELHLLIEKIDAAVIVSPTTTHFEIAKECIDKGKHIFVEKPLTKDSNEAKIIETMAKEKGIIGQVGFVERYNEAFISCRKFIKNPKFIESHRLSDFNPRGTDLSVVLDLMIHDIDIVLSVVDSPIKRIDASGVAVISETPDISNARIEFENGCVANLTASRISLKKMRKTRFFQKNTYIAVDFLSKKVEVVKIKDAPKNTDDLALVLTNAEGQKKQIYFENPQINDSNAIQEELEHFAECIHQNKKPLVSLHDGTKALEVAHQIIACIG